jgi:hypothetical protein
MATSTCSSPPASRSACWGSGGGELGKAVAATSAGSGALVGSGEGSRAGGANSSPGSSSTTAVAGLF